ncbi:hypothetical protein CAPTEDRAFT_221081 [Capitella teleta]|uniref:Threonine aspartase 1 n=1 Tax=Capitella teleta TaxID=283909 RepID=R7UCC4_CAPTE|nr:hypothetical protein CAPTEDRAFT_221081 [Capitella teleta]|eukprot:ELU03771.1 hypothetical protein CAPTEDRAFT_221081 [Capitella teleta]
MGRVILLRDWGNRAGYHSPANSDLYKRVCRDACRAAMSALDDGRSALDAATAAIVFLEDSPFTNAGTGSNLTVTGSVECDASMMEGSSLQFGAVGAVSGVKNPILVAKDLLLLQLKGEMSLGRVPPSTLVGAGAHEWATRNAIPTVAKEDLITAVSEQSKKSYVKNKRKLEMFEQDFPESTPAKRARLLLSRPSHSPVTQTNGDQLLDTVGAVCIDSEGVVASAVSSGGIILKQPGRLGQAGIYGGGCWAENGSSGGVGVSTSGCGEHLTKTLLARECAQCLKDDADPSSAMNTAFKDKFLNSPFIRDIRQPLGGALAVKSSHNDDPMVEVLWAHTTDSMCLAFMATTDAQPKTLISRLPEGIRPGTAFCVQSKSYRFNDDS